MKGAKNLLKTICLVLLLTAILGGLMQKLWSAQKWATTGTDQYRDAKVQMVTCTFDNDWPYTNMNNLTLTTGHVQGTVVRVGYDTTGTDTQWDLILKDPMGFAVFTKTDCTSATEPIAYTVYEDDTEGNPHRGVPFSGHLTIDIDDVAQQDEVQTCTADANAASGTYEITIVDQNTTPLAYNANTAAIVTALEVLSNVGENGMTSVVSTLDEAATTDIVLTFADSLGNVPSASFDVALTGTTTSVTVVETTEGGNLLTEVIVYVWYEQ